MSSTIHSPWLAAYSKLVVAGTLALLFIGGLVTSWQAGMAVPDWPLSFGSLNPEGWWADLPVRLEHGHRLFAMLVGVLVGVLCAWVWGNWRALFIALLVGMTVPMLARWFDAPKAVVMHLSIWPAAIAFAVSLLWTSARAASPSKAARWVTFAAFVCVCLQATLGGLRVTRETAGAIDVALVLRIVHGCVAQAFLCLNVAAAALLSARWRDVPVNVERLAPVRTLAWFAVGAVFVQLIAGAWMRHLGAGLAIPTFPHAAPDGSWMPAVHSLATDLNFLHTRVGSVITTVLVCALAVLSWRRGSGASWLVRPAAGLSLLIAIQFALGVFVIWHTKPRTLTTLHVLNGAAVLATTLLIATRLSKRAGTTPTPERRKARAPVELEEVHA